MARLLDWGWGRRRVNSLCSTDQSCSEVSGFLRRVGHAGMGCGTPDPPLALRYALVCCLTVAVRPTPAQVGPSVSLLVAQPALPPAICFHIPPHLPPGPRT